MVTATATATATAGPARFDSDSKSFRLTYTYAALPSPEAAMGGSGEPGALQKASDEQDRIVKSFLGRVSEALSRATRGNARIESLNFVRDVKQADVIIALDTPASRGGWATPLAGAGTGQPGRLNLYYDRLAQDYRGDPNFVVNTAAHELCHYFFGLPDEYKDGVMAPRCPLTQGPGCLMDNYFNRGWDGVLCDEATHQHNAGAPTFVFAGTSKTSCMQLVRDFLKARGAQFDESAKPTATPAVSSGGKVSAEAIRSASSQLLRRPQIAGLLRRPNRLISNEERARLLGAASSALEAILGEAKKVATSELTAAALRVVAESFVPPPLVPVVDELLREAPGLLKKVDASKGRDIRVSQVLSQLLELRGKKVPGSAPTPQERAFLAQLADDVVAGRVQPPLGGTGALDKQGRPRKTVLIAPPIIDPRLPGEAPDLVKTQSDPAESYTEMRNQGVRQFLLLSDRDDLKIYTPDSLDITKDLTFRSPSDVAAAASRFRAIEAKEMEDDRNTAFANRARRVEQIFKELARLIRDDQVENITIVVPPGGLGEEIDRPREEFIKLVRERGDVRLDIGLVGTPTIPPWVRDLSVESRGSVISIADRDEVGAVAQRLAYEQTQGNWLIIPEKGVIDIPEVANGIAIRKQYGSKEGTWTKAKEARDDAKVALDKANDRGGAAKEDLAKLEEALKEADRKLDQVTKDWSGASAKHRDLVKVQQESRLGLLRSPAETKRQPSGTKTLFEREEGNRVTHKPPDVSDDERDFIALKPFYFDGRSDLELIVNLSQPLPGVNIAGEKDIRRLPRLGFRIGAFQDEDTRRLIEEKRHESFEALEEDLYVDRAVSDRSVFVFRMPGRGVLGQGWYTPVLKLYDRHFVDETTPGKPEFPTPPLINYTFSIGTLRPNSQALASLVQAPNADPKAYDRGTLASNAEVAVIQTEVHAGSPIRDAEVTGYAERIEEGSNSPIRRLPLTFHDDGPGPDGDGPDKLAGDGIYTATLGLSRRESRGAEYRVFVEALSVSESHFTPTGEALQDPDHRNAGREAKGEILPRAPKFQRATSVQFRVLPAVK